MSFNKAIIIGNVGGDPEIKSMNNGDRVAQFSVATSERWKDKTSGERKESTEWHRVVVFNQPLIDVIDNYVSKGSQIAIEGQIKTRKWEKDGQNHYSTEIVIGRFNGSLTLLGKREGGGDRDEHAYGTTRSRTDTAGGGFSGGERYDNGGAPREDFSADLDDEIPF
jgi:single-strand DNA-binding protein